MVELCRRRRLIFLLAIAQSLILKISLGQEPATVTLRDHEKRYCISNVNFNKDKEPSFHCTHEDINYTYDENGRQFRKNNKRISAAIAQRIDGSEAEQSAIREVIRKQDEYMLREVYALPEYESVRYRCLNRNELCSFWAAVSECESNRLFMLSNCAAACRFCLLSVTHIGQ